MSCDFYLFLIMNSCKSLNVFVICIYRDRSQSYEIQIQNDSNIISTNVDIAPVTPDVNSTINYNCISYNQEFAVENVGKRNQAYRTYKIFHGFSSNIFSNIKNF